VRRNRGLHYDLRRIAAAGGPVCCEPLTNVLYCLSRLALGKRSLTDAIVARLYDDRSGLFTARARPEPRTSAAVTWAALAPLALPDLPEAIGRRLVEEQLLRTDRFWLPVAPPSVAASDRSFSRTDVFGPLRQRRYWRGPTWINASWLVWLGLLRLGYSEQARDLAQRATAAVHASGLREYYDPYTRAGMGARQFGWSSLIMEMIAPHPQAANSYIATG
jgi:glycogen debranching enzyme